MASASQAGRRRVPRAEREEQMLAVARGIFSEVGYEAASMDAIAEGVGVTKPMLYAYFGSKEGLFLACTARAQRELTGRVREAVGLPGRPVDERLWLGVLAFFDFVDEHRGAWAVVHPESAAATEGFGAEVRAQRRELIELLAEIFTGTAIEEGLDPEVAQMSAALAYGFVGAAMALATWWIEHPEEPKDLQALRLMNFVWMGIAATLRGELWMPPVD